MPTHVGRHLWAPVILHEHTCFLHVRACACYTCEHMLPTRASTCFLHVRARYLFVRARLLFKNVRPGQLKTFQTKIYRHWMQLGAQLCWRWIGWTILFYNDCWRTSRPVHKCQTNLNCLFLALITFCKNQIVGKNLRMMNLCESQLLRLYFSVFQPSVLITFNTTHCRDKLETFLSVDAVNL